MGTGNRDNPVWPQILLSISILKFIPFLLSPLGLFVTRSSGAVALLSLKPQSHCKPERLSCCWYSSHNGLAFCIYHFAQNIFLLFIFYCEFWELSKRVGIFWVGSSAFLQGMRALLKSQMRSPPLDSHPLKHHFVTITDYALSCRYLSLTQAEGPALRKKHFFVALIR